MTLKREFYFIRHGQTDHSKSTTKTDHGDVSLNSVGREQARKVTPLIAELPVQTVCCSPLKRAKETKELIIPEKKHIEFDALGECTAQIWNEMTSLNCNAYHMGSSTVKAFLDQAKTGLNQALEQTGPVLIVAHGGIHWAICYWLNIQQHNWIIDNCRLVHFSTNESLDLWEAELL